MKVAIAMSGGVDSSVAAALLKEEGHEVIGATMRLMPQATHAETDAANIARRLGIPHHVMDFTDIFARRVIDDFCREYSLGRTPNPCVLCNKYIKFGILWERARELGADLIATGHHARIERDETSGNYLLKKGADIQKDQSYFLCRLTQEQLSNAIFPVGNLTKDRVRQIARELELPAADRPESQEICFIPDDDYPGFLKNHIPGATGPGPILDREGNIMGQHRGLIYYTVGQRKGLGIAAAEPLYVIAIDPDRNAVIVGTKEQTYGDDLVAGNLNWIAIIRPERPIKIKAKVRYRQPEAEAIVSPLDCDSFYVKFAEPQMAITPGQAIVFYEGDTVTGGGTILRQGR
ncbi:MAG TPA: tRNA 2-thiouridine(34) synthase MnmA [Dehalococcoidales bacterium]|nr:tRNA 2-thiouridine(34) synthase MnmA [Dehalococcoidales bacterium]